MTVDVVIPVRNREKYIRQCLASVMAQTVQPARVIVVDDGSTDGTAAILAELARSWSLLRIVRSDGRGASHARNLGIRACAAPLVAFLDSDDVWLPEKLQRQLLLFETADPPGLVHCGCMQIDADGDRLAGTSDLIPSQRGHIFDTMVRDLYHILGSCSAVVARRDLVLEVGGFDETLSQAEDQDLWLKLASRTRVDYDPGVLVQLRAHPESSHKAALDTDPVGVLISRLSIWNKWLDRFADRDATLDALRGIVVSVARSRKSAFNLSFGLYARLVGTRLEIVGCLFPNYLAFLKACHARRRR